MVKGVLPISRLANHVWSCQQEALTSRNLLIAYVRLTGHNNPPFSVVTSKERSGSFHLVQSDAVIPANSDRLYGSMFAPIPFYSRSKGRFSSISIRDGF